MLIIAVAAGLALGQAIDFLFPRLYTGAPLGGRLSRCDACRAPLRAVQALPLLGFALDRGRCRECGDRLPLRALVLAPGSAALFVVAYLVFDSKIGPALLGGFFATVFLTLTLTDLDRRLLPNRVVYPSIILAATLSWAWPETSVVAIVAGGVMAALIAAALLLMSLPFGRNAFGMGDVKMIVLMGFVLGLPSIIPGLFLGTFAGGLAALFLLLAGLKRRGDYIPHGPFLALGAVIALFWGQDIWDWYVDR
jgi:leader peptidase (prepilin peptidase)/N-methyltransferase